MEKGKRGERETWRKVGTGEVVCRGRCIVVRFLWILQGDGRAQGFFLYVSSKIRSFCPVTRLRVTTGDRNVL